jgi:hypothetical protein
MITTRLRSSSSGEVSPQPWRRRKLTMNTKSFLTVLVNVVAFVIIVIES